MGTIHYAYTGYVQNAEQEFFRLLLDNISKDLNKNKQKYINEEIRFTNEKDKILPESEFSEFKNKKEKSFITDLFYNEMMAKYTCCICSDNCFRYQNIFDFPLLIPEKVKEIELVNLIKYNFNPEFVDFNTKCNICNLKTKHLKEIFISKAAPLIIFSIQRIML